MQFVCEACGLKYLKWVGRCNCGEWNSLTPIAKETGNNKSKIGLMTEPKLVSLEEQTIESQERIKTNISEFNRAIGGGLVPGGVILISGDPGIGKSTLLLQICNSDFEHKKSVVYISGEESISQIQLRAKRLDIKNSNIKLGATNNLEEILSILEMYKKDIALVIIDSIQTIASDNLDGSAGSIGQIRYCTQKLIEFAKSENICVIIVGHITKEGAIAGPKVLEHSVDTVLHFEGERNYAFRVLRTIKNRFGPTDEIGIFEIFETGLKQIENPSMIFLNQQQAGVSGSMIFLSLEGTRLLALEIQALVAQSFLQMPRRAVIGWDNTRLQMICAVLEKHCKIVFGNKDVYLNVMGGLRINEPAGDLPVLLAIISSYYNIALPTNFVAFGEIGLSGEIRNVHNTQKRVNEARKLACHGIISSNFDEKNEDTIKFKNVQQAVNWVKNLAK